MAVSLPAGRLGGRRAAARADKNRKRFVVSREFDALPIASETRSEIANKIRRHVRSLWAEGAPGWKAVTRYAATKLIELVKIAGVQRSDQEMLLACRVPHSFVEQGRVYHLVHLERHDAKEIVDKHQPRAKRSRVSR